jgi:hypothetical protein
VAVLQLTHTPIKEDSPQPKESEEDKLIFKTVVDSNKPSKIQARIATSHPANDRGVRVN